MEQIRNPTNSVLVGLLVSVLVALLIVTRLMDSGSGEAPSLENFLEDRRNLIFTLFYASLFFCGWLVKGVNNKSFLVMWTLALTLHYFVYWQLTFYFQLNNLNIYVLNWAGLTAGIPLFLVTKYRIAILMRLYVLCIYLNFLRDWAKLKADALSPTKFEFTMQSAVSFYIAWEFLLGAYLTSYGFVMGIGFNESFSATMAQNGHFVPFQLYFLGEELLTIVFGLIIIYQTFRDRSDPDNFTLNLTPEEIEASDRTVIEKFKKRKK